MDSELRKALDDRWREYVRLRDAGEHYSSLLRVAAMHAVLSGVKNCQEDRRRCESIKLDEVLLGSVQAGIVSAEQRISKILSVGNKWNEDEILLIITIRVQNDLLMEYLRFLGCKFHSTFPKHSSSHLRKILDLPPNRKAFFQAINLAKRNWGLPILHPLLS
jgi:hypothetical protein